MGDLVCVGSCAGKFYGISASSGEVKHEFDVSGDGATQFHGNPLIVDSMAIFATDQGRNPIGIVYAFNLNAWKVAWKNVYPFGVPSDAAFDSRSIIYLISREDSVLALNLATGEQRWGFGTGWVRQDREFEWDIEYPRTVSSPLYYNGCLFFTGRDTTVYCLDAETGKQKWATVFDNIITSAPVISRDRLLFGLESYELVVMDIHSGRPSSRDSLPSLMLQTPAVEGDTLIFLGGDTDVRPREVIAFDLTRHTLLWRSYLTDTKEEGAFWYVPRIHLWDSWVIVGTTEGTVVAYDIADGSEQWRCQLEGPIRGIGHADSRLFVGTFEGTLHCLTLSAVSGASDK